MPTKVEPTKTPVPVEFEDLRVRLECTKCGVIVIRRLDNEGTHQLPATCPFCSRTWIPIRKGTPVTARYEALMDALIYLRDEMASDPKDPERLGVKLAFSYGPESPTDFQTPEMELPEGISGRENHNYEIAARYAALGGQSPAIASVPGSVQPDSSLSRYCSSASVTTALSVRLSTAAKTAARL